MVWKTINHCCKELIDYAKVIFFIRSFKIRDKNSCWNLQLKKSWSQSQSVEFILLLLVIYNNGFLSLYHILSPLWVHESIGWNISAVDENTMEQQSCRKRSAGDAIMMSLTEEFEKQNFKLLACCNNTYIFKPLLLTLIV